MSLGARREKARELFSRGYTNVEVAREIQISPDTAARYRRMYEAEIKEQANSNPNLLRDIVSNTVRALRELDQVRQEAWRNYEDARTPQAKATFLNTSLKALDQRAKLFQLFGVKAEYMAQVALIQRQQEKLIEFMAGSLCDTDRQRLEEFLVSQIDLSDLDALAETAEPARSEA